MKAVIRDGDGTFWKIKDITQFNIHEDLMDSTMEITLTCSKAERFDMFTEDEDDLELIRIIR
jgi:hypothetical protein